VKPRSLEDAVWRTIKLEGDEEAQKARRSRPVFATCTSALISLFHRFAYVWFLLITVLELLGRERELRMTVPFLAVLVLGFVMKVYHEWARARTKAVKETAEFEVWAGTSLVSTQAKQLQTGDLLKLKVGDFAPADILVLASGRSDQCALLDCFPYYGTPKLKAMVAISETQRLIRSTIFEEALTRLNRLKGIVRVIQPIADIGYFRGQIKLAGYPTASPLTIENLVLKGCRLCNTPWMLGIAVYVGEDCKAEMNRSTTKREKWALVEKTLNFYSICLVPGLFLLSVLCASLNFALKRPKSESFWSPLSAFFVLYAQIVPASLYLLLDFARIAHILFFSAELNTSPSHIWPKNLRLAEALGQVEYILTDKTGTLTANDITLKTIRVGNSDYTRCSYEESMHQQVCLSQLKGVAEPHLRCNTPVLVGEEEDLCGFAELKAVVSRSRASMHSRLCECMALCNAVLVSQDRGMTSQSREETALLHGVQDLGISIHEKTSDSCTLTLGATFKSYSILAVTDYKPSLRRMRVLVQRQDSQEGLLIIKGAVDTMKSLISLSREEEEDLDRKVAELARRRIGLFLYAVKQIEEGEMAEIAERLDYLEMTDSKGRKVEGVFKDLERDCVYLGFAGLQDPILPSTTQAISELQASGIKVWVLSGDHEASTIAAALETGLISPRTPIASLNGLENESLCRLEMANAVRHYVLKESISQECSPEKDGSMLVGQRGPSGLQTAGSNRGEGHVLERRSVLNSSKAPMLSIRLRDLEPSFSLSIDGVSFRTALRSEESREMLSALLYTAHTVLFHSIFPHQKAMAVRFVRENFRNRPVTLAVGDEVNDISMIQEADIGVAVRGRGSREVGGVSDLEISSFAALAPLLLTHGKAACASITLVVTWWVYASAVPVCLAVLYAYFSEFSAVGMVSSELWDLFILLTAVFTLIAALSESEVRETDLDGMAERGKKAVSRLFCSVLLAVCHAGLVFTFVYLSNLPQASDGLYTGSYETLSGSVCLAITVAVLGHIWQLTRPSSVLTTVSALIMLGTLLFTYQELSKDLDGLDLAVILGRLAPILGEFGGAISCFTVSFALFQWKTMEIAADFQENIAREMETTSRLQTKIPGNVTLAQIYRCTRYWTSLHSQSNYQMHGKWLFFSSQIVEQEYQQEMLLVYLKRTPGIAFSAAIAVYLLYSSLLVSFLPGKVAVYLAFILLLCISPLFRWNLELITTFLFLLTCAKLVVEVKYAYTDILSYLLPVSFSLYSSIDWKHNVGLLAFNLFSVFYTTLSFNSSQWPESAWTISTLSICTLFSASLAQFNYQNEQETRAEFKLLKLTKLTTDRAKDVLNCLFPSFVLKLIWKGELPIALDQNLVTVLFCDVCDFDMVCSVLGSQELMDLLDDLFKKLDDMCESYGLAKVETVGKTYLACAGLKERENELATGLKQKNHARRACEMAFEIMTLFKEYTVAGKPLQANIGINSGPVIAGVVGSEKPQFALIGDTVNTASRMSSTAPHPSSIQITTETYELLGQQTPGIVATPRNVAVKGKGDMLAYVITESNSQIPTTSASNLEQSTRRGRTETTTLGRGQIFGNWRFSTMMDREGLEASLAARSATHVQKAKEEEMAFKQGAIKRQERRLMWGCGTLLLTAGVETALWIYAYSDKKGTEAWPLAAIFLSIFLLFLKFGYFVSLRLFPYILLALGLFYSVGVAYSGEFYESSHENHTVLIQIVIIVYIQAYGGLFYRHSVLFFLFLLLFWLAMIGNDQNRILRINAILSVFPALVMSTFFAHKREQNSKVYTTFETRVSQQMHQTNTLIGKMMPPHVYESLLNEHYRADVLVDVTLVFADIVGFTALSSEKSPREMVHLLSELFSGFDDAAAQNGVYKVHTIGDCYVAMGYTGKPGGRDKYEECLNIMRQAYNMLDVIGALNADFPELGLGVRIGIHTGKVIAGITGAKIVRYDIYGPDVLIANKMESNGCKGRVHVSDITKSMLEQAAPNAFAYEFNKEMELKSISATRKGYFVEKLLFH